MKQGFIEPEKYIIFLLQNIVYTVYLDLIVDLQLILTLSDYVFVSMFAYENCDFQMETTYVIEDAKWTDSAIYGCQALFSSKSLLIHDYTVLKETELIILRKCCIIC